MVRHCATCGREASPFDVHCRNCGGRLDAVADPEYLARLEDMDREDVARTIRVLYEADQTYAREYRKSVGRAVGIGLVGAVLEFFKAVFQA